MDVIIFADRKGQELLPLTDNTSVCLLPLAGKMLIEHTLEALVEAGFRQAHIVLSPFADQVKAALGSGERWGMTLTYSTNRGEEAPRLTLANLMPAAPVLLVRGDVARSGCIGTFLQHAESQAGACVNAVFDGKPAFLQVCRETDHPETNALSWTEPHPASVTVELAGQVAVLDSLADYHQANLDAAAGRLTGLIIPGRQTALGLTQGRNTEAYPQNLKQGIALIGSTCHLHPSVELSGEVVIGDHVIIDRRATLTDTVVLPHSYIGELVDLRNALVRGNDLIRVDTGAAIKISDAFLLADLKTTTFNKGLGTFLNSLAGLLLLLFSLPLWVVAALLAFNNKPGSAYSRQRLRGNKIALNDFGMPERTEFWVGEWQVDAPVLRHLPRILAVISGDLSLMGTLPVTLEVAAERTEEWEKLADLAPAGLLGPTQLHIPNDAPMEEKLLSDSFYAAHFNLRHHCRYLMQSLQVLFTGRAWGKSGY